MEDNELLDRIEDIFTIEDVLYIIGKDYRWFLLEHFDLIKEHEGDFL